MCNHANGFNTMRLTALAWRVKRKHKQAFIFLPCCGQCGKLDPRINLWDIYS